MTLREIELITNKLALWYALVNSNSKSTTPEYDEACNTYQNYVNKSYSIYIEKNIEELKNEANNFIFSVIDTKSLANIIWKEYLNNLEEGYTEEVSYNDMIQRVNLYDQSIKNGE